VPQESAPFRYSGRLNFAEERGTDYDQFERQTGIELSHSCGIDTSGYAEEWRGVAPRTEVVLADFHEVRQPTRPARVLVPATALPPDPTAAQSAQSARFGDSDSDTLF
jgi:hypothetical protein